MFRLGEDIEGKLSAIESKAEKYFESYKRHIEVLEKHTLLGRVKGVTPWDIVQVGEMFDKWKILEARVNEEGLSSLGSLPKVAFDVISLAYGNSVIPFIASVQNIEEERGTVYFKVLKRADTGEVIASARTGMKLQQGLASNTIKEVVGTTSATITSYNVSTSKAPIRPETLGVNVGGSYGKDDGNGNILGVGLYGTVDYSTGAITINLYSDPGANVNIEVTYQLDVEAINELPKIDYGFESIGVLAKVYALKGTIGVLQSFALKNRFGIVAEDELAKDLVVAINNEIGGDIIRLLNQNAPASNTSSWSKTPPSGVSYFEHKQTIKDAIAEIEGNMGANAGRGAVNTLICGTNAAAILSTLPGFTKLSSGKEMGAHVYGELDGMIVIRVNDTTTLSPDTIIGIYNPDSPFEGAAVYAPYMPLMTTDILPEGKNPLTSQKAVAVWAAVDVMVPEFIGKINITA